MKKEYLDLASAAKKAKGYAYAPYSRFRVGAALLTDDSQIFTGCNIENSSFGLTICAERVALFHAISHGITKFRAILIISDSNDCTPPCGACRQVISELAGNIDVIMMNEIGKIKIKKLNSLLPFPFTSNSLKHRS